jgi:hypothetical protein
VNYSAIADLYPLHKSLGHAATYRPQSQSHIATDDQSISKSRCRAPFGAYGQIFITLWQLRSCFCETSSLTRGWVCILHMLLVLVSVDFLDSESLRTRDHILLSQISDFPFRRLLRFVGSRWRYSWSFPPAESCYTASGRTTAQKTPFLYCWPLLYCGSWLVMAHSI